MSKKKASFLGVVVVVLACIFLLPALIRLLKKDEPKETYLLLDVYEVNMTYDNDQMSLDLIEGVVKTNQQIDKIFVNINGIGTQYLDFDANLVRTNDGQYIAHYIPGVECICATAFADDGTVTVDTYIEYGGRSYKVDTQKISVKSCWSDFY